MSKAKLAAARELIEEHEWDAGRAVLETMPDNLTAQRWMKKLPKQKRQVNSGGCALAALMLLTGIVIGLTFAPDDEPATVAAAATDGPSPTITETQTPTLTLSPTLTPTATNTPIPTSTPAPLIFSGSAAEVIGPVSIPAGLYRATFTTAEYGSVTFAVSEGECGAGMGMYSPLLFNEIRGRAASGAEAVMRSTGCRTLIEVSNVQAPWTLEFEIAE